VSSYQINDTCEFLKKKMIFGTLFSALNIFAMRIFSWRLVFDPIFRLSKFYQLQKKHVENGAFAIADEIIAKKEKQSKLFPVRDDQALKPQIFIDQLYKMRDVFDSEEIRDEINTTIVAVKMLLLIHQAY